MQSKSYLRDTLWGNAEVQPTLHDVRDLGFNLLLKATRAIILEVFPSWWSCSPRLWRTLGFQCSKVVRKLGFGDPASGHCHLGKFLGPRHAVCRKIGWWSFGKRFTLPRKVCATVQGIFSQPTISARHGCNQQWRAPWILNLQFR